MIHQYQLNGYNIVLDVFSGAVHVVDDLSYSLIAAVKEPVPDQCPEELVSKLSATYAKLDIYEAYEEILNLQKQEILFSEDTYGQFKDRIGLAPVKAICLHVAHDCNMRCAYCFASTGDFGQGRKLMSFDVGKKAIDFVIKNSENRRNIEVDFFGGEPLMNFAVVKQIVEYARAQEEKYNKHFRFTITTNGLLLDEDKMDYINKEMSNVVLSIDGRKEVTDNVRKTLNGKSAYDSIIDKCKQLVEKRDNSNYYVRGTFTKYNLDFSEDILHLFEQGFDQISVEPVVSDPKMPYAITEKELDAICQEYERAALKILEIKKAGRFINFFHFMIDLDQGPCAIKRLRGCGSGNEYLAVTPDGDIYPCHQFVGMEEFKMGTVAEGTLDMNRKKQFATSSVYTKQDCLNCWARFYCSGGCNANNYNFNGDIEIPHKVSCQLEKKRIECAIMIKAALS